MMDGAVLTIMSDPADLAGETSPSKGPPDPRHPSSLCRGESEDRLPQQPESGVLA